jgi:hypothetical protein
MLEGRDADSRVAVDLGEALRVRVLSDAFSTSRSGRRTVITVLPYSCLNSLNSLPSVTRAMTSLISYDCLGSAGTTLSSSLEGCTGALISLGFSR